MYQKSNWDTDSLLDKIRKKEYTGLKHLTAFNDDATADAAVDYLYAKDNQSKTRGFLQNYGFPSAQDRDLNKQLYGVPEEKQQLRDILKSKTNSILNPKLPTETDRAFLHGLMGEKDGEDDYQKQISDATRAKDDLLSAFRNTPFESGLKPDVLIRNPLPKTKPVTDDVPGKNNELGHTIVHDFDIEYDRPRHSETKSIASILKSGADSNEKNVVAYTSKSTANLMKTSGSGPDGTWEKRGFLPWQRTYKVEPPKWDDYYYWNNSFYQERTNCYAYALNTRKNPITNEYFAMPGSKRSDHIGLAVGDYSSGKIPQEEITKENVVAIVDLDIQMLGWTMEQATLNSPVPKGKWKIAIVIDPGKDYHFYRQNADGSWSHKLSTSPATQLDASGNKITNPQTANSNYSNYGNANYNVFCGYFIIGPN